MTRLEESSNTALIAIDSEFCQHANEELTRILFAQDRKFAARFEVFEKPAVRLKFMRVGRAACVALCTFGFSICTLSLALDSYDTWWRPEVPLLAAFTALGLFAWFVAPGLSERLFHRTTRFRESIRAWSVRSSMTSSGKLATRVLKKATALAPYEARYTLRGSMLRAERVKSGQAEVAWQRDLTKYRPKGLGISGEKVTVIFRSPRSLLPAVCILHLESDWIRGALERFGIPVREFGEET